VTAEGSDAPAGSLDETALADALRDALGRDPGAVSVSAIEGGASRQTFLIESELGGFVLRRDPPGAESYAPLALELRAIEAAARAGVPVAEPLAFEPAGGRFESAGFLMRRLEGTSVATRILRREEYAATRAALPGELAQALARIHSVDPGEVEGIAGPGDDPALSACEFWEQALDETGEPLPAVEAGLRRLRLDRPPPPERPALVHGDFRLGNFLVDERGLAAVLDWELCHAGDPAEDVGWLSIRSWRFGNDSLPVAGLGETGSFLDAYEASGGARPDPERVRWWEAMGNVKWAVICARQAHDHLTGVRPSAELASLGRRICEPEWDLLELLRAGSSASRPGPARSEAG
jgi:aminoglycoside phosphotransferase (APT) family kinase protein